MQSIARPRSAANAAGGRRGARPRTNVFTDATLPIPGGNATENRLHGSRCAAGQASRCRSPRCGQGNPLWTMTSCTRGCRRESTDRSRRRDCPGPGQLTLSARLGKFTRFNSSLKRGISLLRRGARVELSRQAETALRPRRPRLRRGGAPIGRFIGLTEEKFATKNPAFECRAAPERHPGAGCLATGRQQKLPERGCNKVTATGKGFGFSPRKVYFCAHEFFSMQRRNALAHKRKKGP